MTGGRGQRLSDEGGLALVVVLWLLVALSLAASTFAAAMRGETTVAANEVANAKARALADAGVHRGILALFDTDFDGGWRADGGPHTITFGGADIAISLHNEGGKIDLNSAPEELILSLLRSMDLDRADAESLTDAILDWRDEDDLKRVNGAETLDYEALDLPYTAKNGPFESIDELQQVKGMTRKLYLRLAPAITVYSGLLAVDPAVAPAMVLFALPGVSRAEVEGLLEIRRRNQYTTPPEPLPDLNSGGEWLTVSDSTIYTVRSRAALTDGTAFVREAVIWLPEDGEQTYWVLDWRAGAPALETEEEPA